MCRECSVWSKRSAADTEHDGTTAADAMQMGGLLGGYWVGFGFSYWVGLWVSYWVGLGDV